MGSVQKNGPGAKAGLEPGDVIVKFNDQAIKRSGDLPPMVSSVKPGSTVKLEVWRDGKPVELSAMIGGRETGRSRMPTGRTRAQGKLGVVVRPLSAEEREASKLAGGVVVEDVGGAAAKAGVRPGDVIVSANRTPITSTEQLKGIVDKAWQGDRPADPARRRAHLRTGSAWVSGCSGTLPRDGPSEGPSFFRVMDEISIVTSCNISCFIVGIIEHGRRQARQLNAPA